MKIEQFWHNGANYQQTPNVSNLLPEDKIIELYNWARDTRKPIETVQLHQTYFGPPVISITAVTPSEIEGRQTTTSRTFLVSLKDVTGELVSALRPFFNAENLEVLEVDKLSIHSEKSRR